MSQPPPPGFEPSAKLHSAASLPPRPPPSLVPPTPFKQANHSALLHNSSISVPPNNYDAFQGYRPRPTIIMNLPSAPKPPPGFSSGEAGSYQQAPSYYLNLGQESYAHSTPPQILNPFPLPADASNGGLGRARGDRFNNVVDPEMEAQIAHWQSAYTDNPDQSLRNSGRRHGVGETYGSASGANAGPLGGRYDSGSHASIAVPASYTPTGDSSVASVVSGADGKQKTVVRSGGGQTWTDSTLLEWDPAHFRLFVGNLAGEVTDDSLLKAFSAYSSVQKARVIRDKRTMKSKGFGFVSFSDGDDYFLAARDMQGKYIGSHPVLLRRSTTEIKASVPGNRKNGKYKKGGNGGRGGDSGVINGGIKKKSSKTKGGLNVLG
ncbi:MAG: hypothetical protein M1829_003553 [Trizodia sp. TS-e1964]|nr:MAG: hypothetical protein M1829_003553 [Trizodia sp. TS-e1964]